MGENASSKASKTVGQAASFGVRGLLASSINPYARIQAS